MRKIKITFSIFKLRIILKMYQTIKSPPSPSVSGSTLEL